MVDRLKHKHQKKQEEGASNGKGEAAVDGMWDVQSSRRKVGTGRKRRMLCWAESNAETTLNKGTKTTPFLFYN